MAGFVVSLVLAALAAIAVSLWQGMSLLPMMVLLPLCICEYAVTLRFWNVNVIVNSDLGGAAATVEADDAMSVSDARTLSVTNQQEFTQEGKSNSDDEIQVWFVVETPPKNHKCKKLKSMGTPPRDVINMVGRTIVTTIGAHRSETTTLEKEHSSSERTTTNTKPTAKRSWLPQPPLDAKKKND
ncbi:hypothetical protein Tco_1466407 [Tanacetum coccineum]